MLKVRQNVYKIQLPENISFVSEFQFRNCLLGLLLGTIANITKYRTLYEFPTETDLKGTALALLRIQKVYDISIKSIANGDYHDNQKYR